MLLGSRDVSLFLRKKKCVNYEASILFIGMLAFIGALNNRGVLADKI